MTRAPRTKRSNKGMTLVETLFAVLLVTLLTGAILVGSQAALRVYAGNTFAADSRTVSDTLLTALSDVLRYAEQVETDADGSVTAYSNSDYGISDGKIYAENGMLCLDKAGTIPLISDISYAYLRVRDFSLSYENGVFSGSYRLYNPANNLISEPFPFSLRTLRA